MLAPAPGSLHKQPVLCPHADSLGEKQRNARPYLHLFCTVFQYKSKILKHLRGHPQAQAASLFPCSQLGKTQNLKFLGPGCHETERLLNRKVKSGDVRKAELTNLHTNLKQFSYVPMVLWSRERGTRQGVWTRSSLPATDLRTAPFQD